MKTRILCLPTLLSAGFFVAALVQVWNHIMWRDEIRTWQVAREASGLISLWDLMRYEGVPVLWYWIVFVLTRFTDNPFAMQFVHVVIATGVVYVVARWAPFSSTNKILFSLGYFPFFEYAAITRNYSLVFLLIVIACAMIAQERIRLLILSIVLFLLTQVSIWGAGFGGLLLIVAAIKAWTGPPEARPKIPVLIGSGAMVLAGFILCIVEVLPGPGPSFTDSWAAYTPQHRLFLSLGALYRAWIPLPIPGPHFWNTNLLDLRPGVIWGPAVQAILAVGLFIVVLLTLIRRPLAVIWFVVGTGALLGFTYLKFKGFARHEGMLFVVLVAGLWLSNLGPRWLENQTGLNVLESIKGHILTVLLAISAISGVACAAAGLTMPFSATRAVADVIIKERLQDKVTLAAYTDYGASPISQWVGKPFYSINMQRDVWYNTQDDKQRLSNQELTNGLIMLDSVHRLIAERNLPVLLMLNSGVHITHSDPLINFQTSPDQPPKYLHVLDVVDPKFEQSVVKDEQHKLYLIRIPVYDAPAP